MSYNASFDEASYYQGNKFQLGGNDRNLRLDSLTSISRKIISHRSDDKIQEDAWCALIRNHKVDLGGIDLMVKNGTIKIIGRVNRLSEKQEAENTLLMVPGIIDIINDLGVNPIHV